MIKEKARSIFVSRSELAARCEVSVDTIDQWVREGYLPAPSMERGQIRRWHWPSIEARFSEAQKETDDPYLTGVRRASGHTHRSA